MWSTFLSAALPAIFGNKGQGKVLAGAAGGLLGAGIEKKQAAKIGSNYYVNLRNAAEKGGFHPLEALRAGGGQGYAGAQRMPVSTTTAIQNAHDTVQDVISGEWMARQKERELNNELRRVQIDEARTNPAAVINKPFDYDSAPELIKVYRPDGSEAYLRSSTARRYGIRPGDYLTAGDWQEFKGELVGEVENVAAASDGSLAESLGSGMGSLEHSDSQKRGFGIPHVVEQNLDNTKTLFGRLTTRFNEWLDRDTANQQGN